MAEKANKKNDNEEFDLNLDDTSPSYGTGVHDQPSSAGRDALQDELSNYTNTSPELTGGDVDARWEDADAVGDEAVGGTAPTPDQNVTEEIEAAVGLEMDDRAFLRTNDILEQRDDRRWELDPTSSEDYQDRRD